MPIVINRSDGGVSVIWMNAGFDPAVEVDIWANGWGAKHGLTVVSWVEVSEANVPTSGIGLKYRECWKLNGNAVDIDMTKAKALRVAELTKTRKNLIELLSARIEQAIDDGATNAVISRMRGRRKALRDLNLTTAVAGAANVAALDSLVPTEFTNVSSEL